MSHSRWTNAFYLVPGVLSFLWQPPLLAFIILGACTYLAIGSYAYHTTLLASDALHDERGMYLVAGALWATILAGAGLAMVPALSVGLLLPLVLSFNAEDPVVDSHVMVPLMILIGSLLVVSFIGVGHGFLSLAIFSLSGWIRSIKGKYEDVFHGLWHIGTSAGISHIIIIS